MNIIGANAAGILNKLESFHRIIGVYKPSVVFLQETKTKRKKKIPIKNYVPFEVIRTSSAGGGLLIAVHESLKPVCITENEEENCQLYRRISS